MISAVKSHRVAKKGKDTLDDLKQRDVVTGCMWHCNLDPTILMAGNAYD